MRKIFIVTLIFLLVSSFVSAYSLLTGMEIIYFEPGLKTTISFVVKNNDPVTKLFRLVPATDSKALMAILDDVIYLREREVMIEKGKQHEFLVDLILPGSLPYGVHQIYIRIYGDDLNKKKEGMIVMQGIVSFPIRVYSLYPGKYLVGSLLRPDAVSIGEVLYLKSKVRNIGTEDIINARTKVDIYKDEEIVGSVYSDYKPIASKETKDLIASLLITEGYEIGEYIAEATVEFDGDSENVGSRKFNVGELNINIVNITSRKFGKNKINKFDIEVESIWNKPADVYAEVIVSDFSGNVIEKFKTQSVIVEGWRKKAIPAYFDAKGIENGLYSLRTILHYEGRLSRKDFAVEVSDKGDADIVDEMPGMPKETLIIIILSSVVVLLIIAVLFMMFFKRKREDYNEIR